MTHRDQSLPPARGFTLVELVTVTVIISVILAIAFPQLLPALAFSNHEGAARHLAGYGRSAIAYSTLMREPITVKVDLDAQEYWTVHWVEAPANQLFEEDEKTAEEAAPVPLSAAEAEAAMEAQAAQMQERFARFAQHALDARTRNVKHEGILSEIGPLFEEEFTLEDEEDKGPEPLDYFLLSRTAIPEGVVIESVRVGTTDFTRGVVDVELTPLGLAEPVVFYLRNDSGDYYTVAWDPITGGARLYQGREQL